MPITLHIRDVPDEIHAVLTARAEREGMSVRRYVLGVLADHATLPTIGEWLDGIARKPSTIAATPGTGDRHAAAKVEHGGEP